MKTIETIMVGVRITVPRRTVLPSRYKGIFHGNTVVERGHYFYWYPVRTYHYSKMVNSLKERFGFKVEYGVAGTHEV